jgi:hypothetical protein
MQHQRLSGGKLISAGYDAAQNLLEIGMADGSLKTFSNVPLEVYTRSKPGGVQAMILRAQSWMTCLVSPPAAKRSSTSPPSPPVAESKRSNVLLHEHCAHQMLLGFHPALSRPLGAT